jgi:hypothetical protein
MKTELEEAAEKWCGKNGCGYGGIISNAFETGAKWQQKNSYSEEDMHNLMDEYQNWLFNTNTVILTFREWFEQFKKK